MPITTLSIDPSSDASTRRALSDISLSVAKSKKIVVVTGAGISCSSGIPDFRSSDGLYNLVKKKYPNTFLKGRDLFDASLFRDSTSTAVFYTFISELKRSIDCAKPTPTHKFIKTLDSKKKLLRSYTQNIDGLEADAGLLCSSSEEAKGKGKLKAKEVKNVQLHGDIRRVRCITCCAQYPCTEEHLDVFNEGIAPDCPECSRRSEARVARSARPLRVGSLRPAIVLYDEPHPLGDDIGAIQTSDLSRKPDLLIIMGTSLKVHGLKKLVKEFAKAVHSSTPSTSKAKEWAGKVIFVNRTPPGSEWNGIIDYHIAGETDKWVEKVLVDWKKMRPTDWETQQTLVTTGTKTTVLKQLKVTKDVVATKSKPTKGKEKPVPDGVENIDSSAMPVSPRPPSSPSKRPQATSHYSEHSSPSKKHAKNCRNREMDPSERVLLFERTNRPSAPDSDGVGFDMHELRFDEEEEGEESDPGMVIGTPLVKSRRRTKSMSSPNVARKTPAKRVATVAKIAALQLGPPPRRDAIPLPKRHMKKTSSQTMMYVEVPPLSTCA